ncbi:MAG: GH25 family lysozyme [Mesorhizobium sp.]
MRSAVAILSIFAGLTLAGCSTGRSLDDFVPRTSSETTSSVNRPSAPVASVAQVEVADTGVVEIAAMTPPQPIARAAEPEPAINSLVEEQETEIVFSKAEAKADVRPKATQAAVQVGRIHARRFRDAKPINFGKVTPKAYAVHGVDVSRWQGNIDWQTLKLQGANFAYIKATDGGDHLDPMFKRNWREAREAGLKRGAYHFFYWCRDAASQANWFIRNVPRDPDALPPVIDVEWNHLSNCKKRPSPKVVREKMQVFMDKLEAHYGKRPVIYTAPDFYADNLRGQFESYPFWLRAVAEHPSKVYPGRKWVFWQYSGTGLSQGVGGRIDLNVFHGSPSQWWNWLGGQEAVARAK